MIADGLIDHFRIPFRRLGAAMSCWLPPNPVILGCGSEFDDGPGWGGVVPGPKNLARWHNAPLLSSLATRAGAVRWTSATR